MKGKPVGTVEDDDAVVIANFRADRVVEISKAFEYEDFDSFDRVRFPKVKFVGLMQYDGDLKLPANYLVPPPLIERTSGEWLAKNGLKTFACSETQKFGHVTFFWNGNRSGYFNEELETYVEIPSDNVPFNQAPLMKAREITAAGKEALLSGKYDVVRINYANPDMVGHTGDMAATCRRRAKSAMPASRNFSILLRSSVVCSSLPPITATRTTWFNATRRVTPSRMKMARFCRSRPTLWRRCRSLLVARLSRRVSSSATTCRALAWQMSPPRTST
jgi:hypothetical protein